MNECMILVWHMVIHRTMWITLQLAYSLRLPLDILLVISPHPPDFSKSKIVMPEGQDIAWVKTCWNLQKAAVIKPECMCTRQEVKIPGWDLALLRRSSFSWVDTSYGQAEEETFSEFQRGWFCKGCVCVWGVRSDADVRENQRKNYCKITLLSNKTSSWTRLAVPFSFLFLDLERKWAK